MKLQMSYVSNTAEKPLFISMQISCTVYLDNATEELLFFQLQDGFYIRV